MKYLIFGALGLILTAAVIQSGGLDSLDILEIKLLAAMLGENDAPAEHEQNSDTPPEIIKFYTGEPEPPEKTGGEIIISVLDCVRDEIYDINLEEYLAGVVFSEMPASFELEALKAQAVAARSYSVYKILHSGADEREYHGGADICDDARHCKAYLGKAQAAEKYGDIEYFWQIIKLAVSETAGEIITYKSEPAIAVFHAMSADLTESAENIWGSPVPYLTAVPSQESNNINNIRNFETEIKLSAGEFKNILAESGFNLNFAGEPEDWIENISLNSSGRVDYIIICGEKIPGVTARGVFGLRSTNFTLENTRGGFIFTVYGYGHGVGMSQYGANLMAMDGRSYAEILKWYYTGTEIAEANLFFE